MTWTRCFYRTLFSAFMCTHPQQDYSFCICLNSETRYNWFEILRSRSRKWVCRRSISRVMLSIVITWDHQMKRNARFKTFHCCFCFTLPYYTENWFLCNIILILFLQCVLRVPAQCLRKINIRWGYCRCRAIPCQKGWTLILQSCFNESEYCIS